MKTVAPRQIDSAQAQASRSALDSAFRMLARRDHTGREMAIKLRQKGFDRDAIEAALSRCRELGYLDDVKTALAIAGHLAASGYGPRWIRQFLGQKGLDDATIAKALAGCGDEETQVLSARRMLGKKKSRLDREADPLKRRQVAYRFLAGRGFSSTVINRAIIDI
jgi:regulatory protein